MSGAGDLLSMSLADLVEERKRLDGLLDDALEQFARFEEEFNPRMKVAPPDQLPALMAERANVEELLGIATLVDQIDLVRLRIDALKAG
ncbi:hypothetical protein [Magnetospirillum sp. UT-4]|uniref:hypothetical protein n=1 Tax=Magnetospirillum sp. UT-4 TaxID=2681467 RepID=UPI0013841AC2|nr:hypothetical protein [Magnetospirillum sp. UT-4]CAA7623443.1 conserved hypothetical protein [Magnetospirillum sp. UT-4]